ncbi:YGGT family-domain-containing protein [Pavlovales sp. CCMP2436]|nr:YGGT family-domain-containing protein [Pavlovales sp. CCMP2436]
MKSVSSAALLAALCATLPAFAQGLVRPVVSTGAQQVVLPSLAARAPAARPIDLQSIGALASTAAVLFAPLAASAAVVDSTATDAANAALARSIVDPILSIFSLLFLIRIVLSWYPQFLQKMPYKALALPTEPFLRLLRTIVEPIGGVDITPIVWLAICTFLREILVGPQGILSLIAAQRMG